MEHVGHLIELEKGKLYSRADWLMSAEWIRSQVAATPTIEWINTSRPAETLLQMKVTPMESLTFSSADIRGQLSSLLREGSAISTSIEQVTAVVRGVKQSVTSALSLCVGLLGVWEKMHPQPPLESYAYRSLIADLEREAISLHFLWPLWEIWRHSITRGVAHPMGQELHRLLFFKQALELIRAAL